MTISSPGIGSGLDIQSIVPDLVAAEREPTLNRLSQSEATLQAELSAVGLLKSALSDFQSKFSGLKDPSSFSNRTSSSSDTDIAGFSADNDAAAGSYSLEVTSLASAQKLVTQQDYIVSEGTLDFSDADGSFSVTLDSSNNATIQDVRDAINNADDNIGVTATILNVNGNERLVFTANESGTDNALTISGTSTTGDLDIYDYNSGSATPDANGDVASYYDQVITAADAVFSVDGQSMTSSSNTITDVIPDATITLKDSNVGEPITLSISENSSAIKNQITTLVDGYNELIALINEQTSYDADTGAAGSLLGDSLVNTIERQIRNTLTDRIENSDSNYTSLASIGITTTTDGSLELDSDTLDTALENDYTGVATLFSDETQGVAFKIDAMLENYLQTSGTIDGRTDSINGKLEDITDERTALDYRSALLETRLYKQFNAMDLLVAQLNSTGSWLTSALDSLPGVVPQTN
ncbi:flagellar hook protein FliD [Amphritea opalescens]|uniref:Flagellar hook-associated protein 2 n=1 Tax=Amphritea opalescens TaxID=2490544 RepID=A0A430KU52_9GAMM|nr:flagellar filament capping protein FliD [Amphritea opalescens]RTE66863.1 flagellar hook protein FliD [Amphritea opalescens]